MAISDTLQGLREDGYGKSKEKDKKDSAGPRVVKLTDDEAKSLGAEGDGHEVAGEFTGRLSGTELSITSIGPSGEGSGDEEKAMAEQVMTGSMGGPPLGVPPSMTGGR